MGYTTDFGGQFYLDKPLTQPQIDYLNKFADTRRMERDPALAATLPDPLREAVGLQVGRFGAYFTGGTGYAGQDDDISVINHNSHKGQPSLWNHWVPSADGKFIVWDSGEKFYEYVEWIEFIIDNFLKPWGYKLNGKVDWYGEDYDDRGRIVVTDNVVKTLYARIIYEEA